MTDRAVLYETTPEAIWITLNRPDTMNLIDSEVFEQLTECFIRARFDEERSVVVFRGTGRMFSAGGNLQQGQELIDLAMKGFSERLATVMYDHVYGDYPAFHAIESCPKTVICAMNGSAYGAGAVLVLLCDMVIAAEGAKLSIAPGKWGIADTVSAVRLVPRIGLARAKDLIFTARSVPTEELLAMGVVNRVCKPEELDAQVRQYVDEVRVVSPLAREYTKSVMQRSLPPYSVEEHFRSAIGSDFFAGLHAFSEKKPPPWTPQGAASGGSRK
jgi:enoyl-CoA hydratase